MTLTEAIEALWQQTVRPPTCCALAGDGLDCRHAAVLVVGDWPLCAEHSLEQLLALGGSERVEVTRP